MTIGAGSPAGEPDAGVSCPECGVPAAGNFCSSCGADLRHGTGLLGSVSGTARTSVVGTYLRILRAPIKATVALAEDPSYRQHLSFLLSGLAIFCVIMVPFFIQSVDTNGAMARYSESMQTLLKVLSQAGVYVGAIITFVLGYILFRLFSKTQRSVNSYLKLYCLAFGFILPPYAVYDYVARGILHSKGLSSFSLSGPSNEELMTLPVALSLGVALVMWVYFIAIHRRFWKVPVWMATGLYTVAAVVSNKAGYYLMYFVGYWVTIYLIRWGVVTV